ncbi:MAG: Uncharacterized protein G01um10147_1046 [Microgenomates group bacterium Gr01-1014_7]|nr:MAG: Uncharacterized protein G01um10147_1046 [Microgenomates group bacterium Gr01-1014_7]
MNKASLLLLAILLVSFILRINRLDYPMSQTFAWGDGTRDFLVASHIVRYGEFPLKGPYNLLEESGIKGSPIYFYILAIPLLVYNHPLTLGLINIFLQALVLVLIFLIARVAFGTQTALIALTLFSFNSEIIKQSDYIWQPHLMMPLAYLSLYLFVKAIFGKEVKLLFLSLTTITLAFAIHNSAFPWLFALMIAGFFITKNYFGVLLSIILPAIILYIQVILSSEGIKDFPTQTFFGFISNLNFNLDSILNTFYVNKLFLAALLLLSTLLYYFKRNHFLLGALALFLSPILFASFFDKIRFHYLMLSSGIFAILIAYLLDKIKFTVLKLLLIFTFVWIFSGQLQFIRDFKRPLENQKYIDEISKKIVSQLPNTHSFQVKSYAKDKYTFDYPVLDTILLVPLEERLNSKLAAVFDDNPFNHVQINEKDFIVLACYKFQTYQNSDCREDFLKDNRSYDVIKTLHLSEYISVYLAKYTP